MFEWTVGKLYKVQSPVTVFDLSTYKGADPFSVIGPSGPLSEKTLDRNTVVMALTDTKTNKHNRKTSGFSCYADVLVGDRVWSIIYWDGFVKSKTKEGLASHLQIFFTPLEGEK